MLRGMQSTTRPTFAKTHSVTAQAASAIEQARFINFDGRHAMPGDAVQGVSEADVPAGRLASVITGYSAQVECAAAVTVGQGVGPSSDGTGRAAPGGLFMARSSGGVGDLIEVVLAPGLPAPVSAMVSRAGIPGAIVDGGVTNRLTCGYYNPTITHGTVYNGALQASVYRYNHDSSIEFFDGLWWCAWNVNTTRLENVAGQFNVVATSTDFVTWTAPVMAFSDAAYAANPVTFTPGASVQFQPNFKAIAGRLIATWWEGTQGYASYKTSASAKWINVALPASYTRGGQTYIAIYPTQNPIQLPSGRILAPAIMATAGSTAPDQAGYFGGSVGGYSYRLACALISDDLGNTWRVGGVAESPDRAWGLWEPVFALQPDGVVRMYVRNQRETDGPLNMMFSGTSTDDGESFSAMVPTGHHVPIARPGIVGGDDQFGVKNMLHNDFDNSDTTTVDLFRRRGLSAHTGCGDLDFMPGVGFSVYGDRPGLAASYAQGLRKDGKLYICYTLHEDAVHSTGVLTAVLDPAPPAGAVSPRPLQLEYTRPVANGRRLAFGGLLQKFTSKVTTAGWGGTQLTFYALFDQLIQKSQVCLFDNRNGATSGCVIQIGLTNGNEDRQLTLRWLNATVLTDIPLGLSLPIYRNKVAVMVVVDGATPSITTYMAVDGVLTTNTVAGSAISNLQGSATPSLMCSGSSSGLGSFSGDVYRVRVWNSLISQAGFLSLCNTDAALWPELGFVVPAGTQTSPAGALINLAGQNAPLTSGDAGWLVNWTDINTRGASVGLTTFAGRNAIRVGGKASLSIAPASRNWRRGIYSLQYAVATGRANSVGVITIGMPEHYIEVTKVNGVASQLRILRPSSLDPAQVIDISSASGQALQDDQWYGLTVRFAPGTVTVEHERMAPVTLPFAGRPCVFLGRAHNVFALTAVEATDVVYFDRSAISFSDGGLSSPRVENVARSGAWTPVLTFGGAAVGMTQAATFPAGFWYRIGDLVFWSLDINLTAKGSSVGSASIGGLPFRAMTANGLMNTQGGTAVAANNMAAGVGASAVTASAAGSALTPRYMLAGTSTVMDDTLFTNTSRLRMSGTYLTADPVRPLY